MDPGKRGEYKTGTTMDGGGYRAGAKLMKGSIHNEDEDEDNKKNQRTRKKCMWDEE